MNLGERIERACTELNKKNGDLWLLKNIYELDSLEKEVRRNVTRFVSNSKHQIHFNSGQLRIIATKLSNKRIKLAKLLNYDYLYHQISKYDVINDKVFKQATSHAIDLACCQKACNDLANRYNWDAFTCDLAEQQAAQFADIDGDKLINEVFKFALEDCKKVELV